MWMSRTEWFNFMEHVDRTGKVANPTTKSKTLTQAFGNSFLFKSCQIRFESIPFDKKHILNFETIRNNI